MKKRSRLFAGCLIILLFILHLPFLHSDPDYFLSIGRDAFTDEGLNTSQLRNYINHGYLDLNECDNMIKSPLFNLILFVPLKFFGTHLIVSRVTILLLTALTLLFISRTEYFSRLIPVLFATTLLQYFAFQYSHFSLSEMMAVSFTMLGLYFTLQLLSKEQPRQRLKALTAVVLPAFFFSLAYYSKIQFVYIALLLPAAILLLHFLKVSSPQKIKQLLTSSIGSLLFFTAIYFLCWYLPFRSTFDFVMKDQAAGKFGTLSHTPLTVGFNIIHFLFGAQTWWFNSLVVICFLLGIFLFRKSDDRQFKIMFVLSSLWVVLESHKLLFIYLPPRYLVSYYFAAGLMCSVVILQLISTGEKKIFFRAGVLIAALFLIANSVQYVLLFQRRSYTIESINQYFASNLKNSDQPVMGPWAPTATWESKARCIPVWKDFMNDKNFFPRFHPQAILTEPDEAESNQAYSSQGIKLNALADSSETFVIGRWEVVTYWFPAQ